MSDLVERARRGDEEAFDRLYRENVERVYAVCLRMCADRDLAERLTQDAFVRGWRGLKAFRGGSRFSTWLHRIAVNVVLEDQRAGSRRERLHERRAETEGTAVTSDFAGDTRLDLERAITALPRGARAVIVLHDIEGYRYEEIAELMGITIGTVKSQIHRGRRMLREALEPT